MLTDHGVLRKKHATSLEEEIEESSILLFGNIPVDSTSSSTRTTRGSIDNRIKDDQGLNQYRAVSCS